MLKPIVAALFVFSAGEPSAGVIDEVARSGRCVGIAEAPDARVSTVPLLAPGPPPLLSFRSYESKSHHPFGNGELMLDDAGH